MDRAPNMRLLVDPQDRVEENYARLIVRVAKTRLLQIQLGRPEVPTFRSPILVTERLELRGVWPIIAYMSERYPEPELLPGDTIQRALIRSLTEDLMAAGHVTGPFARMRNRGSFIFGATPSLLDLAYLTVTEDDADWKDLHDLWDAYYLGLILEACIDEAPEEDQYYDDDDLALGFIPGSLIP